MGIREDVGADSFDFDFDLGICTNNKQRLQKANMYFRWGKRSDLPGLMPMRWGRADLGSLTPMRWGRRSDLVPMRWGKRSMSFPELMVAHRDKKRRMDLSPLRWV